MPDKTITLANFKYGLDTRRADLASQPGTLQACENAYINSGGEAEKRLAFVNANVNYPENTFGLQDVDDGMETYGSIATPSPMPANVTYVRLQHPTVLGGGSYNPTLHDMTEVVCSCNADGKSFVIAKFTDGNSFLYYDGNLVEQSRNGVVFYGATSLSDLAISLAAQINAIGGGYVAVPNVDFGGNAVDGAVIVTSPSGTYFTPTCSHVSDAGLLGATTRGAIDLDYGGVAGVRAVAKFQVTNNGSPGDTFSINAPQNEDGTGSAALCTNVVVGANATATATAIANAINLTTFITGYSSDTDGSDTVFVYAPTAWGASPNNPPNSFTGLIVVTTGSADSGSSSVISSLQVSITPTADFKTQIGTVPTRVRSDLITASAVGGTPPYTYAWTDITPSSGFSIGSPTSAATTFTGPSQSVNTIKTGIFLCTVTDSLAATATAQITVSTSLESNL